MSEKGRHGAIGTSPYISPTAAFRGTISGRAYWVPDI